MNSDALRQSGMDVEAPSADTLQDSEEAVLSFVGEAGQQAADFLVAATIGEPSERQYAPGIDHAPDGTLRVRIDEATAQALALN